MSIQEIRHPLIRHKLGLLRRSDISTKNFRELAQEVGALLTYEATNDLPLEHYEIQGWAGPVQVEKIAGKKITVVPILRAGIGMLEGVLSLIPGAKVSAVGVARNEETLQAHTYLEKLAPEIDERLALIVDPMLATGGSMVATIDLLKKAGCKEIRAMVLVAAPEGIDWLCISPKASAPWVQRSGQELKLVWPQPGFDLQALEQDTQFTHRFLQPMDGLLQRQNTAACIDACLAHPAWRLSLQTHKLTGIR